MMFQLYHDTKSLILLIFFNNKNNFFEKIQNKMYKYWHFYKQIQNVAQGFGQYFRLSLFGRCPELIVGWQPVNKYTYSLVIYAYSILLDT